MSMIDERMAKDIEDKPSRAEAEGEGDWNSEQEMQQNAFERLGKDSVIIETLVIMNVVFAAATFGLIGALIYALKKD
ncbi:MULTISPECIES: hypothetical protein [Staphylococcus]|uniref:Uncharacterized protein n=1 Tax=Staphylococcus pettenkoferi TaxID=170573 RepID=A0A1Z3U1H0_9STAP|nr:MULTISPECIES: hypothetical protein [Staphylococcus]ASE37117.1 hypothetical protein CEP67_07400 [Staphylococcus pettenkoferi]EHM68074.1 hypothetical protein SEVCU012_1628 [Staphylococcus pettenkoferi VCU012]MBX8994105.1 hypothetical protein [Staphylococcus pettenkoferi]MCI2791434.1 hypothetical protein [Staphylococcus pettenkoferi]MCY1565201.1 hypothetical protein [Staphylococcus pettenkoferi]